ncbi:MAG: RES family NAD+ phosphorylase [Bacteroidota bacterium]|nr:RES family NAD+ phosphorylase [Bacteroidota bacterium]
MGLAKEMMIEEMDNPFASVPEKYVSVQLLDNILLQDFANRFGIEGTCSYSGSNGKVVPLIRLVEEVDRIILLYFGEPDNEGVGWDSGFENDAPGFHSEGNGYIVPDNKVYYDDMHAFLYEWGFSAKNEDLKDDIAKALGYHYCLIEQDPYGLNDAEVRAVDWKMIQESAYKMAIAGCSLDDMVNKEAARLDYLKQDIYNAHYPLQTKKDLTLYRTVNYKTKRKPLLFRDLTSPPTQFTRNLRMSAKGDSVFYGADNIETARKEALSDEGDDFTYVGEFHTKHPIRLLDLTGIPNRLTIFDQEQYYLLTFLRDFCNAISEYVPEHDSIKYAPTQLITYYFRKKLRHYEKNNRPYPIDGILYSSSKDHTMNAVLFFDNENSHNHLELECWELIHQGTNTKHKYCCIMKHFEGLLSSIRKLWMK